MMKDAGLFIADYQHVSLIEYPGKISSIIFTHGCNLRCRYCHNPSLVTGRKGSGVMDDFLKFLEGKDIEAVAVTGGEPLCSPHLLDFLARLKTAGYKIKLDTNGFLPHRLEKACDKGLVDYVAVDLKAFSAYDVKTITRSDVRQDDFYLSLSVLRNCGVDFEVRHSLWKTPERQDVKEFAEHLGHDMFYVQKIRTKKMLDKTFVPYADVIEAEKLISEIIPQTRYR